MLMYMFVKDTPYHYPLLKKCWALGHDFPPVSPILGCCAVGMPPAQFLLNSGTEERAGDGRAWCGMMAP